jgi:hypothetical protein
MHPNEMIKRLSTIRNELNYVREKTNIEIRGIDEQLMMLQADIQSETDSMMVELQKNVAQ